jgi:hypothetical protein
MAHVQDFSGHVSGPESSYLTIYEVHSWILYRDPVIFRDAMQSPFGHSDYTIYDSDLKDLQDIISGKTCKISRSVNSILELLTAVEAGRVKVTGRRNGVGNPCSLPAHYWPHLTLTKRTVGFEWGSQTCACFKTRTGGFWSDLRFARKGVLVVWPPPPGEQAESTDERVEHSRLEATE